MYLLIIISIAIHSCYIGSKVVVSLLALDLGASQVMVGTIAACYAIMPLALGIYSGRLADTIGMRWPMLIGAFCTGTALVTGWLWPTLPGLFVVSLLMGASFVFFNVSIQNLTGAFGRPEDRARAPGSHEENACDPRASPAWCRGSRGSGARGSGGPRAAGQGFPRIH